jgi:PHD/YefM family antitoxin component YafN of YafNO toxin-antitoxin module
MTRLDNRSVRRPHEVAVEPSHPVALVQDLDQLRHLQLMRRLLLDADIALARRVLEALEQQLMQARQQLAEQTDAVNRQRDLLLLERQAQAAYMSTVNRWLSDERKLILSLEQKKSDVMDQAQQVQVAKHQLEESRRRRRRIESRRLKYEEIRDAMTQA